MENVTPPQPETMKPVTYAGFWWRFIASLIDSIIISVISWILILPVLGIFGVSIYTMAKSGVEIESSPALIGSLVMMYLSIVFISVLINWLYFALMESSRHQGTIGKLALRIRVTDYAGSRISFAKATGRYFGKILSSLIFMIGYIMAGFTEKKQALHDIMASCYVIKE
jgi:uncharacterized RDD family membrane protein YckC